MRAVPTVSVIMIFLDAERFLVEALESVLAQTYLDWELLLVDDGSTDGSSAIARGYAEQHPTRVRYLEHPSHENRGMSASRNLGIREARGEFITFLDADDCWLPAKLAEQLLVMHEHPEAAMAYGQALIWHSWTGDEADRSRDYRVPLGVPPETLVRPPALFHLLLANKAQTPMTGNVILRREVFEQVGAFEESFRGMYEDQVFFLKVNLAFPVFVSGACWLKYRQHPDSCVARTRSEGYLEGRRPLMEWLSSYIATQGFSRTSAVGRAVGRERWATRHPRLSRALARIRALPGRAHDYLESTAPHRRARAEEPSPSPVARHDA